MQRRACARHKSKGLRRSCCPLTVVPTSWRPRIMRACARCWPTSAQMSRVRSGRLRDALTPRTVAVVAVNFLGIRERLDASANRCALTPQACSSKTTRSGFRNGRQPLRRRRGGVQFRPRQARQPARRRRRVAARIADHAEPVTESIEARTPGARPTPGSAPITCCATLVVPHRQPQSAAASGRHPLSRPEDHRPHGCPAPGPVAGEPRPISRRVAAAGPPATATCWARSEACRCAWRAGRAACCDTPSLRDQRQRDQWLTRLRRAGLGASAMYECPLAAVEGVTVARAQSTAAARFAGRLLTLPVHEGWMNGCFSGSPGSGVHNEFGCRRLHICLFLPVRKTPCRPW